jgi:serine protease Do
MFKKHLLLPIAIIAGGLSTTHIVAQEKKEKKEIIIRGDEKGEKTVIVVEGDKVIVNGKEITGDDKETIIMKRSAPNARVFMFNTDSLMKSGDLLKDFDFNGQMPEIRVFRREDDRETETTETRTQLGVLTQSGEKGVEVVDVTEPSGAAKAGIQKGDIIVSVDEKKIEKPETLSEYIRSKKAGDVVNIELIRAGKTEKIKATLGEMRTVSRFRTITMPEERGRNIEIDRMIERPLREVNVEVRTQRPKLGLQVEEQASGKGLKVLEVKPDAPAAKSGLKTGDILDQIDGKDMNNVDDMRSALEKGAADYRMNIRRNGKPMELKVSIPKPLRKENF